jgi:dTDP-4-amino-4,6-dideoxygalactose transaminase
MHVKIPMSEPDITAAERAAVAEVLESSVLALGPRLERFERRVAAAAGTRHGIGVSSGTAALHLAMLAAGIGEGDTVVTTPFSFIASANCILYVGARPLFVDVDPESLTMDPDQLERSLAMLARLDRRAKAVIPVHVFGQSCDMDPILDVARRYDLVVVEDACEAIGATYRGRPVGGLGDAGVFAFYPNKQLTTGEGGMLVTDRLDWDALFRSLRNQGRDEGDGWLAHTRLGYNYRLDELSAALGLAQIARLDELLAKRERVASWYTQRLRAVEGVTVPRRAPWTTRMSWFVYVVRLAGRAIRDRAVAELARRGIPVRPYFPPIHLQPFYRARFKFGPGQFPIAEAAGDTCLALPFFAGMREEQVDTVCGALDEVLRMRPAAPRTHAIGATLEAHPGH